MGMLKSVIVKKRAYFVVKVTMFVLFVSLVVVLYPYPDLHIVILGMEQTLIGKY